jgi:precorrin-6A/cobalt-precorrin-6A reductase
MHQGLPTEPPLIWLLGGTGDGPPLAAALLGRGWRLRVSVVSAAATRVYAPHPQLALRVGDLADDGAVAQELEQHRPRWVVDATHPFARRISERLERVCGARGQPLLRLQRPSLGDDQGGGPARCERLAGFEALAALDLRGERLLLAIGSRQLGQAIAASNAQAHVARILDRPASLQLALAAGLSDGQLACLRPSGAPQPGALEPGALERALCRRWRITAVLCRAGGGRSEAVWHGVAEQLGLRLLLLQRPGGPASEGLPLQPLLEKLGHP